MRNGRFAIDQPASDAATVTIFAFFGDLAQPRLVKPADPANLAMANLFFQALCALVWGSFPGYTPAPAGKGTFWPDANPFGGAFYEIASWLPDFRNPPFLGIVTAALSITVGKI